MKSIVFITKKRCIWGVVAGLMLLSVLAIFLYIKYATPRHEPAKTPSTQASTFTYVCRGNSESMPCLEGYYQTLTIKNGVQAAFTKLKNSYSLDANIRANCHQLTHVIGRTEADMVRNVDDAYSQGDNFCWSGYYHGVMESIVTRIGVASLPKMLPSICADIKKQKPYSFDHFNCVHGLGHGIMDVNGSNLFASLNECDLLSDQWEQSSCYGGVFMENEMDEVNPDHKTAYLKADQPMYPCTVVDTKYKQQCYLMQTSHALRVANSDYAAVFAECSAIEPAFIDTCYQSLGRDASGSSSSEVIPTKDKCMIGSTQEAQSNCIIGAVKDFISYYHSDKQADDLCNALSVEAIRQICGETKSQYYSTF